MAAIRIPKINSKGLDYWKSKGKTGKDVMIYTHDDLDGIYSAIIIREFLEKRGYDIKGYGVLNYQQSWKQTSLDPKMINVAVDFSNMPEPHRKDMIDIYIDHHTKFTDEEKEFYKSDPVVKTSTGSAYEGIANVLGLPLDEILLYSIDMVDSAKYTDYVVDWRDILNFNWNKFLEIAKKPGKVTIKPFKKSKSSKIGYPIIAKLTFAGAFNQFIKRGDHKTIIEVIANVRDPSIYAIYNAMKRLYPGNNVWTRGNDKGKDKDFIEDSQWRLGEMQKRTRGKSAKQIFMTQQDFVKVNSKPGKFGGVELKPDGYQIMGNLAFIPSGTWANALRARSIILTDYDNDVIPKDHVIDFIMLQYGNTIQIVSFDKIENSKNLPKLKDGSEIKHLSHYMQSILDNFRKYLGYYDPDTHVGEEEITITGGHKSIATISNIVGRINYEKIKTTKGFRLTDSDLKLIKKYDGKKFMDLFKNKMIEDLSTTKWGDIGMTWSLNDSNDMRTQMVRSIISNDKDYYKYLLDQSLTGKAKQDAIKELKDDYKKFLGGLNDAGIDNKYNEVMMDSKVMMKKDIRKLDK